MAARRVRSFLKLRLRVFLALSLLVASPLLQATVTLNLVAEGITSPTDIQNAGDGSGRLFFVKQAGQIVVWKNGTVLSTPFLNIASLVAAGGERGLLGLAFHPNYRDNGYFFVNYTRTGDGATVIARYTRSATNADVADTASAKVLLKIAQPYPNHNGGQLRFGPDGYLYIGMGDGGSGNDPQNRAQDLTTLLGKMLRIDVNTISGTLPYGIPADNPLVASTAAGVRAETWALGLRNPWRFSFDAATGDLLIGDVGQGAWEEIDFVAAGTRGGMNFGWRVMEGAHCTGLGGGPPCNDPSLTNPIAEYDHGKGCSITGGFVYRGSTVPELMRVTAFSVKPLILGSYVYGDYCSGTIWTLSGTASGGLVTQTLLTSSMQIATFGEDEQREGYVADFATGRIYKFGSTLAPTPVVVEFFNSNLVHYFMTDSVPEANAIDQGAAGPGWSRTGKTFNAFVTGTAGTVPVCRFYGTKGIGPNSHFFTADSAECEAVKRDPGWTFEGLTFSLALPSAGACAGNTRAVSRAYNNRFLQNDSNHRYATEIAVYNQMLAQGWKGEGMVMCAAP